MKCLLEFHGLKLAELQSKVRADVSSEYWLREKCAYPDKTVRDIERLSRLEEEKNRTETRKKKFFAEILNIAWEFQLQGQASLKCRKQRNDGVQFMLECTRTHAVGKQCPRPKFFGGYVNSAWHARQRQRATRAEKLRFQTLKSGDQEAYMKLVEEKKNERLTTLLEKTNDLLSCLGAAVKRQKEAEHSGVEVLKGLKQKSLPSCILPETESQMLQYASRM
ncbi:SNF2/Brahma-type chromatin-remodeling protein CHR12 [Thalictrum thalictroides]|uniref:SNF2/Brahma-type chromatin-remodeling protein CHR12 n=1 Tax=Thalictrum thalictroides TaxID=46969 RepID=A0A7J6XA83_THATH|nr:SNF2/Brahma-type chromatin-remodeling protein CHR12 [Thalictrum thalictroides]